MTDLQIPPAVRQWVEIGDTRALLRTLIDLAASGEISVTCASQVAAAAGVGLTQDMAVDAVRWLDTADDPTEQLEREIHDLGHLTVARQDALDAISGAAQQDLDDLIDHLSFHAAPTSTSLAVLATVRILTGNQP
jgi:hypothetical protein